MVWSLGWLVDLGFRVFFKSTGGVVRSRCRESQSRNVENCVPKPQKHVK